MTKLAIPLLLAVLAATQVMAKPAAKPVKVEQSLGPDALVVAARAAARRGEVDLGLRLAQSAIVADPARPASYVALGDIYADAGQADFARFYYQSALDIDPQEPRAHTAIAALDDTGRRVIAKP